MTITLSPQQEEAVREAIRTGQVASVEEFIAQALAELPKRSGVPSVTRNGRSVFEQGLGLFGSSEDAALLDDVVSIAYKERRRPSKRESML
jgi:Arc/MetJ-type ribon-helix-helix transcriptional regulator